MMKLKALSLSIWLKFGLMICLSAMMVYWISRVAPLLAFPGAGEAIIWLMLILFLIGVLFYGAEFLLSRVSLFFGSVSLAGITIGTMMVATALFVAMLPLIGFTDISAGRILLAVLFQAVLFAVLIGVVTEFMSRRR